MPRPSPTRLREAPPARETRQQQIVDAQFKIVGGNPRPRLASFLRWTLAFAAAAAIGFLVPPLLAVLRELMAMVRGD